MMSTIIWIIYFTVGCLLAGMELANNDDRDEKPGQAVIIMLIWLTIWPFALVFAIGYQVVVAKKKKAS